MSFDGLIKRFRKRNTTETYIGKSKRAELRLPSSPILQQIRALLQRCNCLFDIPVVANTSFLRISHSSCNKRRFQRTDPIPIWTTTQHKADTIKQRPTSLHENQNSNFSSRKFDQKEKRNKAAFIYPIAQLHSSFIKPRRKMPRGNAFSSKRSEKKP